VAIEPFWRFAILGKEVLVKPLIIAVSLPVIAILPATAQLTHSNQYAQLQQSTAQDASQMKMDAVPSLNQDGIRRVQQALQKRGFDPGPLDGILGPKTKEAVRNFQDRYGIKASGEIDNQTLFALGEVELAA
jgi:peptidoglycan hydrolase-like protein with peptidoglycan-binding domain